MGFKNRSENRPCPGQRIWDRVLVLVILALWLPVSALAQAQAQAQGPTPAQTAAPPSPPSAAASAPAEYLGRVLRVMTVERPPFSITASDGTATGFSIDLWQQIAQETGLRYEIVRTDTFKNMLDAVRDRKADLAIANISITAEREATMDFSQPIFDAGLQIMVRQDRKGGSVLDTLLNPELLKLAVPALAVVVMVGFLMWFFERKHHPFFAKSWKEGWWDAIWWSLQRFASAGFQDVIPKTLPGRLIGIFTSVMALFIVSAFVATISATVTVNELRSDINSVSDLVGKRVGTTRASTSAAFLKQQGVQVIEYDNIPSLFAALGESAVDAIVHDAPILEFYASREGRGQVQLVGKVFKEEKYGIALQDGSQLRESIDRALLLLRESGRYEATRLRYFLPRDGAN